MAKTLSELTNDVKFKADWRTLDRIKKRMKDLDKDGKRLHKSLSKPIAMKMESGGLARARKQISQLEQSASRLRGSLSQPMRLNVNGGQLAAVRSQMRAAGSEASSLRGKFLAFSTGVVGGLGLANVARGFWDTNMGMQQMKGALKTATGSTAAANVEFKKLQVFGSTTPFTTEQAIRGFIKLKNLGLDPSTSALRSYGNTASAMGKSLMDMIEAVADASTGEFERLKEFGIKSKSQGDMVEFTFQNVTTKVKKNAKDIEKYLRGIGETKFADAMRDQMNSLPGMVSNAQDSIENFYDAVGEAGVNQALIQILRDFSNALSGIDAAPIGKALGSFITSFYEGTKRAVDGVRDILTRLGGIKGAAELAGKALAVMLAPLIGGKLVAAVESLKKIVAATRALMATNAVSGIFALIGGWPLVIGAAVVALGLLAYDIYKFATGGDSVIGGLVAKFPQFASAVKDVGDAFNNAWPTIREFGFILLDLAKQASQGFMIMGGVITQHFAEPLMNGLATVINLVSAILQAAWTIVTTIGTVGAAFLVAIGQAAIGLGLFVNDIVTAFATGFGTAYAHVSMFIMQAIARFSQLVTAYFTYLTAIGSAIATFVSEGIAAFTRLFTNPRQAAEMFKTAVINVVNSIKSAFMSMIDAVVGAFSGGLGQVKNIIGGLLGSVNKVLGKINSANSGVAKTSMALPGGGRGGVFSPSFNNGGNTFQIYETDPMKVGAAISRELGNLSSGQLSNYAKTVPVMLPGSA